MLDAPCILGLIRGVRCVPLAVESVCSLAGLSIGLLWGMLILTFLAIVRWRGGPAASTAVKDSKSTE